MPWKFAFHFDADPNTIPIIRKLIATTARLEGASETDAFTIEASVNEVLSNAFRHAYGGRAGPVGVDLAYDGVRLQILVSDDGPPIPIAPTIPEALPPRSTGSRGLYLVGQLMDEAEILCPHRDGRGTAVRLVKYLR